jgi:D-alanyl-D-alanine carboxypeptidase/D-alanyl-D-alanine-endopeptidase (penicillin-binding protein 4)
MQRNKSNREDGYSSPVRAHRLYPPAFIRVSRAIGVWLSVTSVMLMAALCSVAAVAEPVEPSQQLPPPVAGALKRVGLSPKGFSAWVQVVGEPEPRLAFNPDAPRNPASVMKVLTTLAALEILGPAYTWRTEAYAQAPIRDGRLEGDLYLKGYGDPFLVVENFWRFLRELRNDGLGSIGGDLVLDQTHFAPVREDPAEFDGQPSRVYNVQPAALLVNFQAVRFHLLPQPQVRRVRVVAEPQPSDLEVVNRLEYAHDHCRDGLRRLGMQVIPGLPERVVFSGRYDAACGEHEIFRVIAEPTRYIHGVFQRLWREQGGRFDGGVREASVPQGARLLYTADSPPLADVVRSVNKFSNNVMTRQLLLTLGARVSAPGTEDKGVAEIRRWLAVRGLVLPELVLDNGSGLSRDERITARSLGRLLAAGYESPYMPEFLSSLPISAVDGTLKRRFGGTPLEGRVHLKTGSLDGVRSMAGYLLDLRGRRVIVVALHNDPRVYTANGEQVQDALLQWAFGMP